MNRKPKLWNRNFTILWQGQLISSLGNVAFSVALGFWVLAVTVSPEMPTGDVKMMGLVEACFALPSVIISPFAGTIADRLNRKWIIICADFIRGLLFTAMGAMLLFNVFPFWAIFPLAVLSSAAGAFFWPAVSSVIPDIVSNEKLSKANSARSFSSSLATMLGNSAGGVLYAILKAPLMILINGISFLYASATQIFMKIPTLKKQAQKERILVEMVDGIKYAFKNMGIRTIILSAMIINFFFVLGFSLLTPLFNSTPGFGVEKYGWVIGVHTAGLLAGTFVLSIVNIKAGKRSGVFGISMLVMVISMILMGVFNDVTWMYPAAFIAGATNAIVNVMTQTIIQATVSPEYRGKVFGIVGTFAGGLEPLAMAASGLIASTLGIRVTIVASFSVMIFSVLPLIFSRHFREYINTDVSKGKEITNNITGLTEVSEIVTDS